MNTVEPVISASGVLAEFNAAGVLLVPDLQLALVIGRLSAIGDPWVVLAGAFAVRQLRQGSVCVDLSTIREEVLAEIDDETEREAAEALPWPDVDEWLTRVSTCPMVDDLSRRPSGQQPSEQEAGETGADPRHPYRLDGSLLYLNRWWHHEQQISDILGMRQLSDPPKVDHDSLQETLDQLFTRERLAEGETDVQRLAASIAAQSWTSVVAGGPGTGKTTTVARLLAALASQSSRPLTIALAAPSGKAAARLEQSVRSEALKLDVPLPTIPSGQTLHSLLGARGLGNGFTRTASNPLPHDVVVLDEASMVDVSMFAALLSALRPTTRLVIVGDPHQLSSVDAGRVLADLAVGGLTTGGPQPVSAVVELQRNWRNPGAIHALAQAIRSGDADEALDLLSRPDPSLTWVELDGPELAQVPGLADDLVDQGRTLHRAAVQGDAVGALAALDTHRILTAHREGRHGVGGWSRQVRALLNHAIDGYGTGEGEWYPGRPILVTANSREIQVFNGDAGVIVVPPGSGPQLALPGPHGPRLLSPSLVDGLESMYALTVHKSQGSQFSAVTVVLPPATSALLTRELLYTAVTRAIGSVRIIGSAAAVRTAVVHHTRRVSGLRLTPPAPMPGQR